MKKKVAAAAILAVLVATAAVLAGVHWDWAWLPPLGRWIDGFVRTPGFGALAAVLAATIAYRGVTRRIAHDRQVENEHRADEVSTAERQQRWEAIMWVYGNIDTADPKLMLAICNQLESEVKGATETRLLLAILRERLSIEDAVRRKERRWWTAGFRGMLRFATARSS